MKKIILYCITVSAFLSGCAQTGDSFSSSSYIPKYRSPTCASAAECSSKWAAARDQIQSLTGMRLRVATDSYLETFTRRGIPLMGVVDKIDLGDGTFLIRGRIQCNSITPAPCADLPSRGTDAFNAALGGKPI
jgi:hypothetical protein